MDDQQHCTISFPVDSKIARLKRDQVINDWVVSGNKDRMFNHAKKLDSQYCLSFFQERISTYNALRNSRAHIQLHQKASQGQIVYGVVDMMFCAGEYGTRANAFNVWRFRKLRGFETKFWVTFDAHSQQMDFCTIQDFVEYVLPRNRIKNRPDSHFIYAIKPQRADYIKIGRWNGSRADLKCRYKTYFGVFDLLIFQCSDSNKMEKELFTHLAAYRWQNELYEVAAFPDFVNFCQLNAFNYVTYNETATNKAI